MATDGQVTMFRPRPDQGIGRRWHVLDSRLNGHILVAPFPCTFIQAESISEQASVRVEPLHTGDVAVLERRVCRHCLEAIGKAAAA